MKRFLTGPPDWTGIDAAVIVSTGRTGTEFLARLFDETLRGVCALHEPTPDMHDAAISFVRGDVSLEKCLRTYLTSRTSVRGKVAARSCDTYVESNNNLVPMIPVLRRAFPTLKIVHVVRDGREVVRSLLSKPILSKAGGMDAVFMTDKDVRHRLSPADVHDAEYKGRWAQMDRFDRSCWYWMKVDAIVCAQVAGDDRAITVRFEDLFDASREYPGVWEILRFLGLEERLKFSRGQLLERMGTKANQTAKFVMPAWESWTEDQRRRFQAIAGEHMARHGYDMTGFLQSTASQ